MKKLRLAIFTNSKRSINVINFFLKQKDLSIENIYLLKSYKNFNKLIKKRFGKKVSFKAFDSFKNKTFLNNLYNKNLDFIIIPGFPKLIPNEIINYPKFGSINLHGGSLPKYRGGSPLNWQIINGEKKIGISCIKANSKFDQGNIINSKNFKLNKFETIKDAHEKANKIFPILTYNSIKRVFNGFKGKKQIQKMANYYKQRTDKDSRINLEDNIKNIFNFVRAITAPYKGSYLFYKNTKVRVHKIKINSYKKNIKEIGKIIKIKNNKPFVICKNGTIQLIKYESTKKILVGSFLK